MNRISRPLQQLAITVASTAVLITTGFASSARFEPPLSGFQSLEPDYQSVTTVQEEVKQAEDKKDAKQGMTVVASQKKDDETAKKAAAEARTLDTLVSTDDLALLVLNANNTFNYGEIVAVIRSNGDLKYAVIADRESALSGYRNVLCFIQNQQYNCKHYPTACIFKIDPETKAPASCQLCEKPFTQQNNSFYQCGHMFHKACVVESMRNTGNITHCPSCSADLKKYEPPHMPAPAKKEDEKADVPSTTPSADDEGPQ